MSNKVSYCEQNGHTYESTTNPGWYRCFRPTRYSKRGVMTEDCGALAICPGCLGHRIAGVLNLFCEVHSTCELLDFPMVKSADPPHREPDTKTQLTLF